MIKSALAKSQQRIDEVNFSLENMKVELHSYFNEDDLEISPRQDLSHSTCYSYA